MLKREVLDDYRIRQADEAAFGTNINRFQFKSGAQGTGPQILRGEPAVHLHVLFLDLFFYQFDLPVETENLVRTILFLGTQPDITASNPPEEHTEEDAIQHPTRTQGILFGTAGTALSGGGHGKKKLEKAVTGDQPRRSTTRSLALRERGLRLVSPGLAVMPLRVIRR